MPPTLDTLAHLLLQLEHCTQEDSNQAVCQLLWQRLEHQLKHCQGWEEASLKRWMQLVGQQYFYQPHLLISSPQQHSFRVLTALVRYPQWRNHPQAGQLLSCLASYWQIPAQPSRQIDIKWQYA